MNKNLLLPIAGVLLLNNVYAQYPADTLGANNIMTVMDTGSYFFHVPDGTISNVNFEYPKGSGKKFTFMDAFPIITGEDMSGTLHVACEDNMVPGPLPDIIPGTVMNGPRWTHVWRVTLQDINDHLANYTSPGYVPSPAIADWPAHGIGPDEPDNIAPFIDANSDGVYDPMAGDYPSIKGTHCLFLVHNDQQYPYPFPNMGLEVQCMAYAFDCPDDSALQNSVFLNYRIINKSTNTYTHTRAGFLTNISLGNPNDDFMGVDVSRGMSYLYNGDHFDDSVGVKGYDSLLPVLGMVMLAGPWQDADATDNGIYNNYIDAVTENGICYDGLGLNYNDGVVDNERLGMAHFISYPTSPTPNPNMTDFPNPLVYNNYLNGLWSDGTAAKYGGYGYPGLPGVNTITTDFTYFDNTDPLYFATRGSAVFSDWNEATAGNTPGNRRAFTSTGEFTMEPGSIHEIDLAFICGIDYTKYHDSLAALPIVQERADDIRDYFNSNILPCGDAAFSYVGIKKENEKENISYNIFPNPVSHTLIIGVQNNLPHATYTIHDAYGKLVAHGEISHLTTGVNVSSLEEGIYFIRVSGTGATKFVVQR